MKSSKQEDAISAIKTVIINGGPTTDQYQDFEQSLATVSLGMDPETMHREMADIISSCAFLFDKHSIMGHIRTKPHGYAGDFEIIERIYQNDIRKPHFQLWDHYSLEHPAAKAVRNRKSYFKDLIVSKFNSRESLKLLNIASGPARDLFETYQMLQSGQKLKTTCVEMDKTAINYAQQLNSNYLEDISFVNKNIFRFNTAQQYDMIWSAGLFDYFNDKSFVKLLRGFGNWIKPGGEIVIGNFNECHNPSRLFMELFGEWHLEHRSESALIDLALQAGYMDSQIRVEREQENINLFLHLQF